MPMEVDWDDRIVIHPTKTQPCGICRDAYPRSNMAAASCGTHLYCSECFKGYIETAIRVGPGCLGLQCPDPTCTSVVGLHTIKDLISEDDMKQYSHYLFWSSFKESQNIESCRSSDCEFAADLAGSLLHRFCSDCAQESHYPVDCETAAKWIQKNHLEDENNQRMFSYTKPCPKCQRPIKNKHRFNSMTCKVPCKHEFCWICLSPWEKHGFNSFKCNRYKMEKLRVEERKSPSRYGHYYDRWTSNNMSKLKALDELCSMQLSGKLDELKKKLVGWDDLSLISQAWADIVEYRRLLQWTYVYGYYKEAGYEKRYFEHLQGRAEWAVDKLHQCTAEEGKTYFEGDGWTEEWFVDYYSKLTELMRMARRYFDKLFQGFENGLQDMGWSSDLVSEEDSWTCNSCDFVNPTSVVVCHYCFRWSCKRCTYSNPWSISRCLMCSDYMQ